MNALYHYTPPPPLSAFVESIWIYQGIIPSHMKERRLPDGSLSLVINLHADLIRLYDQRHPEQIQSYRGMVLSGARSEHTILDSTCLTEVLGVQFKPGGTFAFLPFPVSDLHNDVLSLDMVWGATIFELREKLQNSETPEGRFQVMEQFLLTRLDRSCIIHPVVIFALKEFLRGPYPPSISSVTAQIGLSQTRFIQLFREAVGLTPKQFCRILRFQNALRAVEESMPETWAELALICGYYDQAHFIHDFQTFSGLTPRAYLAQRSQYRNHVPLFE